MGSYYDVRFDPANSDIFSLVLVGGDRLTWSKGAAISHCELYGAGDGNPKSSKVDKYVRAPVRIRLPLKQAAQG
jgi:hypothetical protein